MHRVSGILRRRRERASLHSPRQALPALLSLALCAALSCGRGERPDAGVMDALPDRVDFNRHIKPLLSDRCYKCHGPDAKERKAGLRLDTPEGAYALAAAAGRKARRVIKPGSARRSEFAHRILSEAPDYMMPPPESNLALNAEEKALLLRWIEQGAEYQPHWAFVAPRAAPLPRVKDQNWPRQPIDYFILAELEARGLTPAPEAARETWLRRATLDLTGLPPSVREIDEFLVDTRPDAYERVVDRLLASPHYGERMAVDWLDLARYADSHGYQDDGMRDTWPWRDWVIRAFNDNLPFDQFLTWQLAGDLLPDPSPDQLLATCFNRNHPQSQEGGVVDEEYRVEYVADRVNTLGKALLGLSTECARCHDHKYDPISMEEYYRLFAFFNNNNDAGIVPYNGEAAPTVILPSEEAQARLAALREEMAPLAVALAPENYVADFKRWASQLAEPPAAPPPLAAFDFEEEMEVELHELKLERNPAPRRPGQPPRLVHAYYNAAKNRADATLWGDVDTRPSLVDGRRGRGLRFNGDCGVRFNRDLDFDRHQPFSVAIWVKLLQAGEQGPIFGKTNGDFEGYRGWLCKLNADGTLSFQLNHVWPDNSIDIHAQDTLRPGVWTHLALIYDGGGRAQGVGIYIDGRPARARVLTDNLHKSLLHGKKGTNWSNLPFLLGMELRQSIQHLVMDELRVYDRQLSELELRALYNGRDEVAAAWREPGRAADPGLMEYYLLGGFDPVYHNNLKALAELRREENLLLTDQLEVMIMRERSLPRPTFILDRGAYDAPTREVTPGVPAVFPPLPPGAPANRLSLAQWLTDPGHPLTARVAINRLWAIAFGRGLTSTQEDFGNQGALPSHPLLLDWLARAYIDQGWDAKAMLRMLVLSATYRQSSVAGEATREADPDNRYYSRYPAHRLTAEQIRDQALAACGRLARLIGGPSVYPYQPEGIWEALATRNATRYEQQSGDNLYRRSLYTVWKRSSPPPSMNTFDAPDRYYCVVRRQQTSTPLQALALLNDPQLVEAARLLGERMIREAGPTPEQRLAFAAKALLGRAPRAEEADILLELYHEELADFYRSPQRAQRLLGVGEHPADPGLDAREVAACAIVASALINFEEFVVQR
jgi:hypothetical protein